MKNKKRGKRRDHTDRIIKKRLKMVKCLYQEGDGGYYVSKPGRLKKNNTACGCSMCKWGRKTRRPFEDIDDND